MGTCANNGSSEDSDQLPMYIYQHTIEQKDLESNPLNCSFAIALISPTFRECPMQSVASMHTPLFILGTARVRQWFALRERKLDLY